MDPAMMKLKYCVKVEEEGRRTRVLSLTNLLLTMTKS
jgi:hypothetical protein